MKRPIVLLLLLLSCKLSIAQPQATLLDKPALLISADGIMTSLIQKSIGKGAPKTNYVIVAGGFINFRPVAYKLGTVIRYSKMGATADNDLLEYSRNAKLYYKTYFVTHGNTTQSRPTKGDKQLWLQDQKMGIAYLKVNDVFNIDIFDSRSDTLVKRYSIRRLGVSPSINIYSMPDKGKGVKIRLIKNRQLSVSSSDKIEIKTANNGDLRNQPIDYVLTNLKTGMQTRYDGMKTIQLPQLMANADYELRCSFDIQPEGVSVYRIHVKARWYQLPIVYGLVIGLAILVIVVFIILRLKGEVKLSQKKQTEIEQSILRLQSQLNPHFTFNALSSIQGLMNTNRIAEANDYLQDFSTLLRKTLHKSQQIFNTLDQELEMMQTYIRLEALRYNFDWRIELSSNINASTVEIPTLLLQPLIENAIKHGIAVLGSEGQLAISFAANEADGSLVIGIKDNGHWPAATALGYGLQLTYDRISAINKLSKERKIVLKFDKQNGTTATLTFQNWIN